MSTIDQQFVEYIAKSLVSQPDAVQIERRIDEKGVLLELTVAPEDLGRVIGKHGATAQSLRTLLRALGTKNDARYNLKIVDSDRPAGENNYRDRDDAPTEGPTFTPPPASDDDQDANATQDQINDEQQDQAPAAPALAEPEEQPEETSSGSSVVDKTRQELAELDDLDV